MPAKINLLNQTFGKLTVIEETEKRKANSIVWKCKCECGNIVEFSTKQLRSEGIIQCRDCGINRKPKTNLRENIIGQKYNHLTVLQPTERRGGGKILYECECDCGNKDYVYVTRTDLINGHTRSCGCIKKKYRIGDIINNREILNYDNSKDSNKHQYYICKCLLCGRVYSSTTSTIDKTISCGCQKSIGEFNIITILNENHIKFKKEYVFPNSWFRYDFAIYDNDNNIIRLIEFDGEQHYEKNIRNSGWNTYEKYQYTLENDIAKNQLAKEYNIPLVRIPYWERDNISLDLLMSDKYLII